jgi:hypothetical protein
LLNSYGPLAGLLIGFIVTASLVFAALTVSSQALWGFPIVVSIWIAFVWAFIGRGIATWSTPPHRPRRVAGVVIACSLVAIVALAVSILIALLLIGPRAADL